MSFNRSVDYAPAHAGKARRSRIGVPALSAAAALAFGATGAAAALTGGSSALSPAQSEAIAGQSAAVALAGRSGDTQRASRATARTGVAAAQAGAGLTAPAATGPVKATSYGTIEVSAVAKPKPKPKPVPVAAPQAAPQAAPAGQAAAPSAAAAPAAEPAAPPASSGGNSSTFASQGAALGLGPTAAAVYSAIRSTFGITNIGGYRPGGDDHGSGRAVDVMITSAGQGDAVANWAIANMGAYNISYVIWQQRIWLAGSGGWRAMEDRGSATANHFDHVHISVN